MQNIYIEFSLNLIFREKIKNAMYVLCRGRDHLSSLAHDRRQL